MNTNTTLRLFFALALLLSGVSAQAQQQYSVQEVTTTTPSRMWLNIAGPNSGASQTAIAYIPQGTLGIDFGYDATRFTENNIVSIYSIVNDLHLVIQARPLFSNYDVVQMGYVAPVAGYYTISIDHKDGIFSTGQHIYIKDNLNGTITDLNNGAFSFTSDAGTFNERFEVVYINTTLDTDVVQEQSNAVIVASSPNLITVSAGSTIINNLNIFDVNGRKIYSQTGLNTPQISVDNLTAAKQILIVEVSTAKGTVIKKIVY